MANNYSKQIKEKLASLILNGKKIWSYTHIFNNVYDVEFIDAGYDAVHHQSIEIRL